MNLKARYGRTYRIAGEEGSKPRDPAGFIIPCRRGHPIDVHGWNLLGVATNGRGLVKRLLAVPGLKVTQDGDDGINAKFPPESFAAVAAIVRPKRRRKLSAAHRAKLLAASKPLKTFQFMATRAFSDCSATDLRPLASLATRPVSPPEILNRSGNKRGQYAASIWASESSIIMFTLASIAL